MAAIFLARARYRVRAMFVRAAGGIFFSGSKAQRSEPFREKEMPAARPCDVFVRTSRLKPLPQEHRGHGPLLQAAPTGGRLLVLVVVRT